MKNNYRSAYLRKEHKALLELADRIEAALELASHKDFPVHKKSLTELRALDRGCCGILEHCHSEDRIVESTIHAHSSPKQRFRIIEEHEQLVRLVANFREELRFATVDRLMPVIIPGMDVVQQLRAHIGHEAMLLDDIFKAQSPARKHKERKSSQRSKEISKAASARTMKQSVVEEKPGIPYTMEPHPEL